MGYMANGRLTGLRDLSHGQGMRRHLPLVGRKPAPGVAQDLDLAPLTVWGPKHPTTRLRGTVMDSAGQSGPSCNTVEKMSLKLEAHTTSLRRPPFPVAYKPWWGRSRWGTMVGEKLSLMGSWLQKTNVGGNQNVSWLHSSLNVCPPTLSKSPHRQ